MGFLIRKRNIDSIRIVSKPNIIRGKTGQRRGVHQFFKHHSIRLYQEFGGGHLLPAEGVPEAQLRPQQEVEAVDVRKASALRPSGPARGPAARRQIELLLHADGSCARRMGKGRMAMSQEPSCHDGEHLPVLADRGGNHHSPAVACSRPFAIPTEAQAHRT